MTPRRSILKAAGIGAPASALAACSVKGQARVAARAQPDDAITKFWAGKTEAPATSTSRTGRSTWTQGPRRRSSSSPRQTGIKVTYSEVIQDDDSFFGKIQPQLPAGQSIGYDLMVITNGVEFDQAGRARLPARRSTTPSMPNFTQYAGAELQDRDYDPGNVYSVPWHVRHHRHRLRPEEGQARRSPAPGPAGPRVQGQDRHVRRRRGDRRTSAMFAVGVDPEKSHRRRLAEGGRLAEEAAGRGPRPQVLRPGLHRRDCPSGDVWADHGVVRRHLPGNASGGANLEFVDAEEGAHDLDRQHDDPVTPPTTRSTR